MKTNTVLKISGMILVSVISLNMGQNVCMAAKVTGEQSLAGITVGIDNFCENIDEDQRVNTLSLLEIPKNIPEHLGVSIADTYVNVRKKPGTDQEIIGKLPKNAGCSIISKEDGWAKIKSGNVTGYVSLDYLATGSKAEELAKEVACIKATVLESGLNVRKEASTESIILEQIGEGEQFDVEEEFVLNKKDENKSTWVKIAIDDSTGYVASDYVSLSYELDKAVRVDDLSKSNSVRAKMIETAKKYLGHRYVFGGESLTYGIDCSAFVQQIFRMYGYSLPRTSRAQAMVGTPISSSNAKAGDLVFYSKGGYISHVAICMGNGMIIHASNARDGVKISNMFYKTPAKVVRIVRD